MKENLKGIITCSKRGIAIALFIFSITLLSNDLYDKGHTVLENYLLSKWIISCFICGIGWGAPAVIYRKDSLSLPLKVLIHFAIGGSIYTAMGFWMGTMGIGKSPMENLEMLAEGLIISFLIWLAHYPRYKKELRRMNERIKELQ